MDKVYWPTRRLLLLSNTSCITEAMGTRPNFNNLETLRLEPKFPVISAVSKERSTDP